jgi:hypothetical protein
MVKYNQYLIFCTERGVTFYNRKNQKMKTFDKSYGLIHNWTNSAYIIGDDLWVLTQYGISKAKMSDILKELKDIE